MLKEEKSSILNLLDTQDVVLPSESFQKQARITTEEEYQRLWNESVNDPETFWGEQAKNLVHWFKPWSKVFTRSDEHRFSWFVDGQINASYNCLDRPIQRGLGDKRALMWEGEDGETKSFSYKRLHAEVCRFANALTKVGVKTGDVVTLYLPMIPEAVIALLACARIGATHNVVFAGFSSKSLAERIQDSRSTFVITADGGLRKGDVLPLKQIVDESLKECPYDITSIVVNRLGLDVHMREGYDLWWHEILQGCSAVHEAFALESEHPLFLLYTSGSTGKPKGLLHTTGGYLVGAALSAKLIFDLQPNDVFWCTADIGWITGHSYVIYGPLLNGSSILMYEGAPSQPDWGQTWRLIEKYRVSKFYTAPTAIRSHMRQGDQWLSGHDLSSLKLLGTVGEPINPKAWNWYFEKVGGGRCPIVDTWWQTETGAIMITTLPGCMPTKAGSAGKPFLGVLPEILDGKGDPVGENEGGSLVLSQPWPSMARSILGDHRRYVDQYWATFPEKYCTGDGARCDEDGYYWIMGRIDDVINVSGHRLSTMEIESALVSHESVAEAGVVARPDELTGQAIVCFVVTKDGFQGEGNLSENLREHVSQQIGKLARPASVEIVSGLPKTRSGKIMRRVLRDMALGRDVSGDLSTLEDKSVVSALSENP